MLMNILSIETSCDETAVAVIRGDEKSRSFEVLSYIVSSQVKIHAKWGGVVPNLAAREHLKNFIPVLNEALEKAGMKLEDIDLVSVTQGPGLIPALLLGTNGAKTLAHLLKKPLLGIHHVEGHICSNYIEQKKGKYFGQLDKFKFPILALVISGGHTQLVLMKDFFYYQILGETQDDAVGEAFDKVAKILGLGYPGGPIVSKISSEVELENPLDPSSEKEEGKEVFVKKFPRPMLNSGDLNFSFSGLKTAVLYFWQDLSNPIHINGASKLRNKEDLEDCKKNICFEFEEAVSEVLCKKSLKAIEEYNPQTFLLAGGVAANKRLRADLENVAEGESVKFSCPMIEFCGDNAAMIGVAAFSRYLRLKEEGNLDSLKNEWRDLEADAQMELE
jgi:tRNA N6-adenosine threonylcarbamoyltransferase